MELRLPPHIYKLGDQYISRLSNRVVKEANLKAICELYWKYNPPERDMIVIEEKADVVTEILENIDKRDFIEEVSELSQEQFEYLSHSKRPINNKIENLTWVNKPKCPICGGCGEIELIMFDAIKCRCKK